MPAGTLLEPSDLQRDRVCAPHTPVDHNSVPHLELDATANSVPSGSVARQMKSTPSLRARPGNRRRRRAGEPIWPASRTGVVITTRCVPRSPFTTRCSASTGWGRFLPLLRLLMAGRPAGEPVGEPAQSAPRKPQETAADSLANDAWLSTPQRRSDQHPAPRIRMTNRRRGGSTHRSRGLRGHWTPPC